MSSSAAAMVGPACGRVIDQKTPQGRGADVARRLLHAAVDGLEGGDRDPDHEEQRADELDQHHAPEGADQVEVQEDAGDGDEEAELREGVAGEEGEEEQVADRESRGGRRRRRPAGR